MLLVGGVSRIDGLHAKVETHNKIIKVQAYAKTVCHGYLLVELVYLELSPGLVGIVFESPDVAGIYEEGGIELPEEQRAPLHVHVELHVARLVDEVYTTVGATELARTELAHVPSSHGIGSA